MKLIRLVTDNKGVFTSSFDSDMLIEPQSKMALLNLTFQTEFENITINPTNSQITFKSDITNNDTEDTDAIENRIFTQSQIQEYYDAVELGLNSALSLELSYTNSTPDLDEFIDQNWVFSMFKILDFEGKKRIEYRYVPFLNPLVGGIPFGRHVRKFYITGDAPQGANLNINTVGNDVTTITAPGAAHTTDRTRNTFAIPDRNIGVGNGIYMARCKDIRDNASGLQDNGFAIGLSEIPIPQSALVTSLSDIYRAYEIRVNRTGETYKYVIDGAAELDSGVTANYLDQSISTDVNDHDVMAFEMSDGNINFCVYQESLVGGGYLNLPLGGNWTQSGTGTTENFDETDIDGSIAQYRRTQVGSPALEQWWEAVGTTNWNIYNNKPLTGGATPVDATAVADLATGIITILGGSGITFTPTTLPPTVANPGVRNVFKQVAQVAGKKYYPYMYILGGNANCSVDMLNITIDPFMENNVEWDITGASNESGRVNAYQDLLDSATSKVRDVIPQVSEDQFTSGIDKTARLTLYNQVWNTLGFTNNGKGNGNTPEEQDIGKEIEGVARWDAEGLPVVKDSDNFLVISDSLPLNSYDASTGGFTKESQKIGKRKNILMSIPVNDNNSGLVEYETNTPIFIDINNASAVNQKNLNFRLLRSDFSPIIASDDERAIMTILIGDKSE
tara:strand:+ start:293 stop:2317 length:2025 start_codon:yes stop_codon:yes gene_type:complete